MTVNFAGRVALVTGASSGLGVEFARSLAARGADLVLVARRAELLENQAAELRDAFGVTVTTIVQDLGEPGVGPKLLDELASRGIRISTLINNAGFGTGNLLIDEDSERIAAEIRLNVAAVVDLSHAFLPDLLADGTGVLVNVASTAAFQPLPGMAVYAASKAFVLNFTIALAHETRTSGLKVLALCPGPTMTEFFDVVGNDNAVTGGYQSSEEVIAAAFRALDRRRTPAFVVSGASNKAGAFMASVVPRTLATRIAARLTAAK